jgi:phosphotransferase system enzyme I (PtsP)
MSLAPAPRRLLTRLRALAARGPAPLGELARLVAAELVAEVCSIYVMRPGEVLELSATIGLRQEAVGRTHLRVGEGIVGLVAATGESLNLPDAQNHPAFAYRGETGEDLFASMLAVPLRRAGRMLGVIAVQNRNPRRYEPAEVEDLETVAMLLAEMLAAGVDVAPALPATLPNAFAATSLAAGLALGPAVLHGPAAPPANTLADDPEAERARLRDAVATMRKGLDTLLDSSFGEVENPELAASREVMEAYRLAAADGGWLRRADAAIASGLTAEAAVHHAASELRERMRRVANPYLRERLADVEDMAQRLLTTLGGEAAHTPAPGAILLARRLGPAELLDWHSRGVIGAVLEEGSPSGHAAILARALGLPMVAGAEGIVEAANPGDEVLLDAEEGQAVLRPEAELRHAFARALDARESRLAAHAALRDHPGVSRDGRRITLMLNVGLALELDRLDAVGADGIGLFRTEIAMLARGSVADVPDQAAFYARVLDAAGDRPVVFRTLDLGADKALPGLSHPAEENPAMGWRSLRLALDRPALLRRQARALLLGAGGRPLRVMFPMVANVAEFRAARSLLLAEAARVRPAPSGLSIGAMLEVPALLWQLGPLLHEVDFLSVGTNDLLQFLFAADRSTPTLATRYDLLSPPVLNLLLHLVERARAAGVPLSVCGEHAGRPLEALVMAALGIETLSMQASSLLAMKAALAGTDLGKLRTFVDALLAADDGAASLREPLESWGQDNIRF